jgi:hypothetical protein
MDTVHVPGRTVGCPTVHITFTSGVLHSNAMLKIWLAQQPIIALTDIIDIVFNLQHTKIHHVTRHKYDTSNYPLEKINNNMNLFTKSDVSDEKPIKTQNIV